jgi:hypothetical protein
VRFVVTGEWTRNRLLKVIVWCFLVYTFLLWLSNAGLFFSKMSLNPASIVDYYNGNEEKFMQPRSFLGLLEVLHFHSFAIGIMLLTLTHLLLFVPLSMEIKALGIGLSFFAGIANELSGWGVRFIHPGFAYAKLAFFLTLEGVILFLMLAVARALLFDQPSSYTESER